ncbi:MAG: flagellar basal-body rod protein FlgF [Cohaesibacter sp.]|nr:flagellar basal-body rod protein FlgF [Cohaesibacter sp.]
MENSQLIGLSRQMVLRRKMDVIANNLANINTAGYKADNLLFEEYIMPTARMNEFRPLDKKLSYVIDDRITHQFAPGTIRETGNPVNMAFNDDSSWFVIQAPGGERYTRNGEFDINAQGELVSTEGYPVLGQDGPITFTTEDSNIAISRDGVISTERGEIGRIRVVTFDNQDIMVKEGFSLFKHENPQNVENPDLMSGMVESSNVKGVVEISRMIEVTRAYASLAKAQKSTNDLRERAIEKLGKLSA